MHGVGGGGGDHDPGAVGRERHVVGPVTRDREAPVDPAAGEVDGHHVGEARPGDDDGRAVRGRVHVVDELVVALAGAEPDPEEVAQLDRVEVDLGEAPVLVGDDVDPADPGQVAAGGDDVGGAVPVVAHEHHLPQCGGTGRSGAFRRAGGRGGARQGQAEHGRDAEEGAQASGVLGAPGAPGARGSGEGGRGHRGLLGERCSGGTRR